MFSHILDSVEVKEFSIGNSFCIPAPAFSFYNRAKTLILTAKYRLNNTQVLAAENLLFNPNFNSTGQYNFNYQPLKKQTNKIIMKYKIAFQTLASFFKFCKFILHS